MPFDFSMRVTPAPSAMFRSVGDEAVLLNLKTETYLGLDPVGTRIWTALTASDSIERAFEALLGEYNVDPAQLREDLQEFLGKLVDNELIEVRPSQAAASWKPA